MSVLISDSFKIRESTSDEWEDIQFSINSPGVPVGGTAGQVLAKNSATNYDTEWINLAGIPTGGTTGQCLVKQSGTDYDIAWETRAKNWQLLWENASPTSEFAAQTISIDLSNYDFIIIGFNGWSDDTTIVYQVCEKGKSAAHMQMRNAQYNNAHCAAFQRNLTVSDSGVVINACIGKEDVASTSSVTRNAGLVPAKIYGV